MGLTLVILYQKSLTAVNIVIDSTVADHPYTTYDPAALIQFINESCNGDSHLCWVYLVDYSHLALVMIRFIANVATIIKLFMNGDAFSPAIFMLLKHQSAADATACLFNVFLIIQDETCVSGIYILDAIIYYEWHSQGKY